MRTAQTRVVFIGPVSIDGDNHSAGKGSREITAKRVRFLAEVWTSAASTSRPYSSATRGEAFYKAKTGKVSCASCHGDSPKAHGTHATTSKDILPLAPVANAERFTDAAKVEKWFKRNCNDVLKRACTANEKGDFIAYLVSVK